MAGRDAVVVGSGPNGLVAGVVLARAGHRVTLLEAADEIGGGTRSAELTVPGVLHDVCAAIHPMGAASPALRLLPLAEHGLRWVEPEVAVAHPLDDGSAATVVRDLDATCAGLGADGARWRSLFGRLVRRFDDLAADLLGPPVHLPRHPTVTVPAGMLALSPAAVVARGFGTAHGKALWGGIAAHSGQPLTRPMSAAAGVMLTAAGHVAGWPAVAGGSRAVTDALASLLESLGGEIHTGVTVHSLDELPPARLVLLDVTPRQLAAMAGDRLPAAARRRARRWRYGTGICKIDLAVEGGVPWTAEPCRRAGTVHLGGTFEQVAAAEAAVAAGRMPERPFTLVAQQYLADPARSAGDVHPVWAYCRVPRGSDLDVAHVIEAQIERFAPGFRERIVGRHVWTPADLEAYNPNYVGGDIGGGAADMAQLLARPRLSPNPYATGVPGVYLCSSATPPGPGVHGLCGHHAATAALADLGRGR